MGFYKKSHWQPHGSNTKVHRVHGLQRIKTGVSQSRRHGGDLVGLVPETKFQAPQTET